MTFHADPLKWPIVDLYRRANAVSLNHGRLRPIYADAVKAEKILIGDWKTGSSQLDRNSLHKLHNDAFDVIVFPRDIRWLGAGETRPNLVSQAFVNFAKAGHEGIGLYLCNMDYGFLEGMSKISPCILLIASSLRVRAWLPISDAIKIRTLVFRPEWT